MTLDEAIKHAEKVAEREKAKGFEFNTRYNRENEYGTKCYEYAEEHRQLAEWLKDYKRLLEQQPCDDCVSRQAVQTELRNCEVVNVRDENDNLIGYYNADTVDSIVRNLPLVTPQPKMGRWIAHPKDIYAHLVCDKCLSNAPYDCRTNYCPNCGAKMIESEE